MYLLHVNVRTLKGAGARGRGRSFGRQLWALDASLAPFSHQKRSYRWTRDFSRHTNYGFIIYTQVRMTKLLVIHVVTLWCGLHVQITASLYIHKVRRTILLHVHVHADHGLLGFGLSGFRVFGGRRKAGFSRFSGVLTLAFRRRVEFWVGDAY